MRISTKYIYLVGLRLCEKTYKSKVRENHNILLCLLMMAEPSIIVDQPSAGAEDDIGPAILVFPFH
jgi:hypothetical protein